MHNSQPKEIDRTPPYMKGFESDAEFSEDLWADDDQEITGIENDNLQIQEKEKFQKNNNEFNNKSNSNNITKTYGQEFAENHPKQDKKIDNQLKAGRKEELVRGCSSRTKVGSSLLNRNINLTNCLEGHQLIFEAHQFDFF